MSSASQTTPAHLLDDATVAAELRSLIPIDDADVGPHNFPLVKLEARPFELLLYSLFSGSAPPAPILHDYDHVRVLNEGTDMGRDLALYKGGRAVGVVQCKCRADHIALPEVFREIIRFILFAELHPHLLPAGDSFQYVLALATQAGDKAADLFSEPARVIAANEEKIAEHLAKVIADYESFRGTDAAVVLPRVKSRLSGLTLRLLTETQLNEWLHKEKIVAQRFFPARLVLDRGEVERDIKSAIGALGLHLRTAPAEALADWLSMSAAARQHTGVAATTKRGARYKEPVPLDSVYVTRNIELEIHARIADFADEGGLIAVIGPGGYGKTSLFWRTQVKLAAADPDGCIALPPMAILEVLKSQDFADRAAILVAHVAGRTARGLPTRLLFDTFDVLAHDDLARDAALGLIGKLAAAGATVLISSRPEELSQIALEEICGNCIRLYIGKYDQHEFEEAAHNYCRAFYQDKGQRAQADRHAAELIAAVRQDRPIREICLGPLTLRMLFELYAPQPIPSHLNGFDLYGSYWINKVRDDTRSGGLPGAGGGQDLSAAVTALADAMVGSGVPSLPGPQVNQLVAAGIVHDADVSELINRNLLVEDSFGSIEFFHQTFFEYAAAQALVSRRDLEFEEIIDAVKKHQEDSFLLPVHEQVLLLLAETKPEYRIKLDAVAAGFVRDRHPALVNCALYLHMFSSRGCQSVVSSVISSVAGREKPLLRRYVQLLPNLRQYRAPEVLAVLRAVWPLREWEFREPAVNILLWLSRNDWPGCKRFIDEVDALASLFASVPRAVPADRLVVEILTPGLDADPEWVGAQLTRSRRKRQLHPTVLDFLAAHPQVFHSWSVDKIDSFIERLYALDQQASLAETRPALARLLGVLWARDGRRFPPDISGIRALPKEHLPLTLRALAQPTYALPPALLAALVDETARLGDTEGFHFWLNALFFPALVEPVGHNGAKAGAFASALDALLAKFGQAYRDPRAKTETPRNRLISKFVQRLYLNGVVIDGLPELLERIRKDQWLGVDSLYSLFPVALHLALPEALSAFEWVCHNADAYPALARRLSGGLKDFAFSETQLDLLLRLALARRDIGALYEFVHSGCKGLGDAAVGRALQAVRPRVQQLHELIRSASYEGSKPTAYDMLALLMELGAVPIMSVEAVARIERSLPGTEEKLAIVPLLEHAAQDGERIEAIDMLLQLGTPLERMKRRRVVQALHSMLQPGIAPPCAERLQRLAQFGFASLDDEPSAHLIGKVILGFCQSGDYASADAIASRLLDDPWIVGMGTTQKRTLAHHLDKTFQQLFEQLDASQMARYVRRLDHTDAHLGRLIVVALCKCRRADANAQLRAIFDMSKVSAELKRVIQDYFRFSLR